VKKNLFQPPLELALKHALSYLDNLDESPVSATATLDELRSGLYKPLPDTGIESTEIINELVNDTKGGLLGSAGGRFFGWVIGGSVPAALAADILTSAWDQNAALYATAPAAAVVEEVCGVWLKDLLKLPKESSFALVTGCQMAHVTCLAAARNSVLAKHSWDVEVNGLIGAPVIHVLSTAQKHGTIDRALRLLGFGTACVTQLPEDSEGRILPDPLASALEELKGKPVIVLLQAGDLNIGAYDEFEKLIPIAHSHNAWVHIDGAFGLWAAASNKYSHLLRGADKADSWAVDGHKWLNVPYDSGFAFVADKNTHKTSMSHRASYLTHAEDARDQMDWNPEWSRRGRGFPVYAAIRQMGRKGIEDLVNRCCNYAGDIVSGIGELDGAEVMWKPQINQGLVRFKHPSQNASEADNDKFTDDVMARILKNGEAFFGGTNWRGKRCMRISVSGWQTNDKDVKRTVLAVKQALDEVSAENS